MHLIHEDKVGWKRDSFYLNYCNKKKPKNKQEAHQGPYIQPKTPEQSPSAKEHTNIHLLLTKGVYDLYINKSYANVTIKLMTLEGSFYRTVNKVNILFNNITIQILIPIQITIFNDIFFYGRIWLLLQPLQWEKYVQYLQKQ